MENRQQQILSEIKSMMASIRSQLELLDAKMAELQQVVDPEDFEVEPVDIDIAAEDVMEAIPENEDLPEPMEAPVEIEDIPETEEPAETEDTADEDLPENIFGEPEEVVTIASKAEEKAKPTINDMMADSCAWRKDMPGPSVKDIRSAISLNDRVIFINMLFDEDAQKFVNALTRINGMETLEQAVGYVTSEFPSWDMNSDLVYRFMMAVRRKVQ